MISSSKKDVVQELFLKTNLAQPMSDHDFQLMLSNKKDIFVNVLKDKKAFTLGVALIIGLMFFLKKCGLAGISYIQTAIVVTTISVLTVSGISISAGYKIYHKIKEPAITEPDKPNSPGKQPDKNIPAPLDNSLHKKNYKEILITPVLTKKHDHMSNQVSGIIYDAVKNNFRSLKPVLHKKSNKQSYEYAINCKINKFQNTYYLYITFENFKTERLKRIRINAKSIHDAQKKLNQKIGNLINEIL